METGVSETSNDHYRGRYTGHPSSKLFWAKFFAESPIRVNSIAPALLISIQNPTRSDDLDQLFGTRGCDGVIMVLPHNDVQMLEACRLHEREVVQIDPHVDTDVEGQMTVEATNREAIVGVMEHLLALGHRRIGFITGKLERSSAHQRLQGYREALAAAGIPFDPERVLESDWTYAEAMR